MVLAGESTHFNDVQASKSSTWEKNVSVFTVYYKLRNSIAFFYIEFFGISLIPACFCQLSKRPDRASRSLMSMLLIIF